MKKRNTVFVIIMLTGILLMALTASGQQLIRIHLDGNEVVTDVSPVIVDGRTLVPLRVVSESLGAGVMWDSENSTVEITSSSRQFMAGYEENQMYVMPAGDVKPLFESGEITILDVRPLAAYESSNIRESLHIPMTELLDRMAEIPTGVPVAVFCSKNINAGYAVVLLRMVGVEAHLMDGGLDAWKEAGGVTTSCRT